MFKLRLLPATITLLIMSNILFAATEIDKKLMEAVSQENINIIKQCLNQGADIEARDQYGYTSLMIAARSGNIELVKFLIENGAFLYAQELRGYNIFHRYLYVPNNVIKYLRQVERKKYGKGGDEPDWRKYLKFSDYGGRVHLNSCDIEGLDKYIFEGNSIDQVDSNGKHVFYYMFDFFREDRMIEILNSTQQDIKMRDLLGKTLLHQAVRRRRLQLVKYFLDQNMDINIEDFHGSTPLNCLAEGFTSGEGIASSDSELLDFLIANGADVTKADVFGRTPLYHMSGRNYSNHCEAAKILIEKGAKINSQAINGETPLHNACWIGSDMMVEVLLKAGADPKIKDSEGKTPADYITDNDQAENKLKLLSKFQNNITLIEAASKSMTDSVAKCLIKGCDVDEISVEDGNSTALIFAAKKGDVEILNMLLKYKADPNIQDLYGNTALHYAATDGRNEIVYYLLDSGADITLRNQEGYTAYDMALENNKYRSTQLFKDEYPDIKETSNEERIEYIRQKELDNLPEVHFQSKGEMLKQMREMTKMYLLEQLKEPLHRAVVEGDLANVKNIASASSDLNKLDQNESTALMYAAFMGYKDIVTFLINNGANVNSLSGDGLTSLHLAAAYQDISMVKLLLDMKADAAIKSKTEGLNALEFAMVNENEEAIKLIKKYHPDLKGDITEFKQIQAEAEKKFRKEIEEEMKKFELENQKFEDDFLKQQQDMEIQNLIIESGNDFHIAVIKNEPNKVMDFLNKGGDIHSEDDRGKLALSYAACLNNKEMVNLLLSYGAEVNRLDHIKNPMYPWRGISMGMEDMIGCGTLHYLASEGNTEMIKYLISKGADVNILDREYNMSPLFFAVFANEFETTKCLLEAGADVKLCEKDGNQNIVTIASGSINSMRLLLKLGLDIDLVDCEQRTAFLDAAMSGKVDSMVFLIENDANINAVDASGNSALHYASSYRTDEEAMRLLLEYGIDVNIKNNSGQTPLFSTMSKNGQSLEKAKFLINQGADINVIDDQGQNILHKLVSYYSSFPIEMIEFFIKEGIDVDLRDNKNRTPLNVALENYFDVPSETDMSEGMKIVKMLIDNSSELPETDSSGEFILSRLLFFGFTDLVVLLVDSGVDVNYSKQGYKQSPLYKAIGTMEKEECYKLCKLLIERGADINGVVEINGETPVIKLAGGKRPELFKLFIESGADLDIQDNKGRTALFEALEEEKIDNFKMLIEAGANLDIQDRSGYTVLHISMHRNRDEYSKILLEAGARYDIATNRGETVKERAEMFKKDSLLKLMN